jgi:hypothetical protein
MNSRLSHVDTCVDTEDLPLNSSPGKPVWKFDVKRILEMTEKWQNFCIDNRLLYICKYLQRWLV